MAQRLLINIRENFEKRRAGVGVVGTDASTAAASCLALSEDVAGARGRGTSGVDRGSAAGTRCVETRNAESRNDRGGRGRDGTLDGPRISFRMGSKGLIVLGQRRVDKVLGSEVGAFADPSIMCLDFIRNPCGTGTAVDNDDQHNPEAM